MLDRKHSERMPDSQLPPNLTFAVQAEAQGEGFEIAVKALDRDARTYRIGSATSGQSSTVTIAPTWLRKTDASPYPARANPAQ